MLGDSSVKVHVFTWPQDEGGGGSDNSRLTLTSLATLTRACDSTDSLIRTAHSRCVCTHSYMTAGI
jgi:hypothetical protein